jgi:hypothetical protein
MSALHHRVAALAALLTLGSMMVGPVGAAARTSPAGPHGGTNPANDDWANAIAVGPLPATKSISTLNATEQALEPESSCGGKIHSVWYKLTPPSDMVISVDTFGSDIDTRLAVWTGPALDMLTEVACSYGSLRDGPDELAGRAAFRASGGVMYFIQVHSQNVGQGGPITLHAKAVTPLANDQFGAAQAIGLPFHVALNNARATTQAAEPTSGPCLEMRATVWYRITPAEDMVIRADTFGSVIDTMIAVFTGPSLAALTYRNCDDDSSSMHVSVFQSAISWRAKAGKSYWLQVGGYLNETGPIELDVRRVTPPLNDARSVAKQVTSLPFSRSPSNRNATQQKGETVTGCGDDPFVQSVWYRYTAPSLAPLHATVSGDDGTDSMIALFTGTGFDDDVELDCVNNSTIDFTPTMGVTYYFMVAGGDGGSGPLQFSLAPAP